MIGFLFSIFPSLYFLSDEEESVDNSDGKKPLTKIKAVSSDPAAGEVTYAIKSENLKTYFEIDANTGMLWVRHVMSCHVRGHVYCLESDCSLYFVTMISTMKNLGFCLKGI